MGTQTTIIPSRIDASATDNTSIDVTSQNKIRLKPEYENANIILPIAEHELEIIELQANATLTGLTNDSLISDTTSDNNGYNNTIQTGTTTALYDSTNKKYIARKQEAHGVTLGSTGADTRLAGFKVTMTANATLKKITKSSNCTATKAYIYSTAGAQLATANFSSNVATFDYSLVSGTSYYLACDSAGGSYTQSYFGSASFPYDGTYLNFVSASFYNEGWQEYSTNGYNIDSLELESGTKTVDISLGAITGSVTHTELVLNQPDAVGTAVYKLKNATQSDLSLALETKNALVNLTTNPTGIEIILPAGDSVKSFALKVFKS
jgi:hypothetical protein